MKTRLELFNGREVFEKRRPIRLRPTNQTFITFSIKYQAKYEAQFEDPHRS